VTTVSRARGRRARGSWVGRLELHFARLLRPRNDELARSRYDLTRCSARLPGALRSWMAAGPLVLHWVLGVSDVVQTQRRPGTTR
jgi:hypothetical protein